MAKSRILYIDILKLFTIYLVLWGHAIQHFQPDYRSSIIYQIIYAFHMPLFMMMSGYFAVSSMELSAKRFFPKKFRQLLLPCISWGIVCWLVISSGLIHGEFHLEIIKLFTGWLGIIDNFWFLKSCFICYTLFWICWRFGKYKFLAMGVVYIMCMLQGRFFLNIMFPCFLVGMFLRQSKWFENTSMRNLYLSHFAFIILLSIRLFIVDEAPYIIKLALGLSGAISCFQIFKYLIDRIKITPLINKLAQMGGATLGIYILQAILLEVLLPWYVSFERLSLSITILLMPILALLTLIVCLLVIRIIKCSNIMSYLMLGIDKK